MVVLWVSIDILVNLVVGRGVNIYIYTTYFSVNVEIFAILKFVYQNRFGVWINGVYEVHCFCNLAT